MLQVHGMLALTRFWGLPELIVLVFCSLADLSQISRKGASYVDQTDKQLRAPSAHIARMAPSIPVEEEF